MTSKNTMYQLTPYQNAMLTHMGIVCWKSIDKTNLPATPKVLTSDLPNPNRVPSAEQKQAGLAKLKQQMSVQKPSKSIDVKQHILLCFNEQQTNKQFLVDVLIWFGVEERSIMWAEKAVDQYHNYVFAWNIGEDVGYRDKVLSTPPLSQLTSTQAKKRLWTLLQRYSET